MTSEENKAIVRRLWEIASAGDLAAFSEVYAADVVYHEGSGTNFMSAGADDQRSLRIRSSLSRRGLWLRPAPQILEKCP